MLWRKLQSMRQAIARHQEQKNFNTLFQSRTICAPSAFAGPRPPGQEWFFLVMRLIMGLFCFVWGGGWGGGGGGLLRRGGAARQLGLGQNEGQQ